MRLLLSVLAGRAAAGLWVAEASRLRAAPWTAVPRPGRKAATRNPPTEQPTPFQSNPIQSDTGAAEYLRAHARLMQLLDLGHRLGLLSTGEWQLAVAISVVRCAMLLEQLADRLSLVGKGCSAMFSPKRLLSTPVPLPSRLGPAVVPVGGASARSVGGTATSTYAVCDKLYLQEPPPRAAAAPAQASGEGEAAAPSPGVWHFSLKPWQRVGQWGLSSPLH